MFELPIIDYCLGYASVVEALISRGARTDIVAENQGTCFDVAKTNGHTEVLSLSSTFRILIIF
jgi:hypothetical protein